MNKIKGSPNKSNSSESSKEKISCEVVHFFTYWLGGKILPLTADKQKELVDLSKKEFKYFSFVDVLETPLHWLVHGDFIKGSIIGQWNLKVEDKIDKKERSKIYDELRSKKTEIGNIIHPIIKFDKLSPGSKELLKGKTSINEKGEPFLKKPLSKRKRDALLILSDGEQHDEAVITLFLRSQINKIFIPEDTFEDEVLEAISVKLFWTGVLSVVLHK